MEFDVKNLDSLIRKTRQDIRSEEPILIEPDLGYCPFHKGVHAIGEIVREVHEKNVILC